MTAAENDGRHDFDFLAGRRRQHIRRLRDTMDPECTEWLDVESFGELRHILGGLGNVDTTMPIGLPPEQHFEAATIRLFNPETGLWRLWYTSSRNPVIDDCPMEGKFTGNHGQFFSDEVIDGKAVRVRFDWFDTDTKNPHSEQSFSFDGGETWFTNWSMTFTQEDAA
jgi:hypothetical protein